MIEILLIKFSAFFNHARLVHCMYEGSTNKTYLKNNVFREYAYIIASKPLKKIEYAS
jgi:hypothetical protein